MISEYLKSGMHEQKFHLLKSLTPNGEIQGTLSFLSVSRMYESYFPTHFFEFQSKVDSFIDSSD